MYLADYHTHTRISPDAGRSMTEMAEAAIAAGLQLPVRGKATPGDDAVDMGMEVQLLPPGMEDLDDAWGGAQELPVRGELQEGLCGASVEEGVQKGLVGVDQSVQLYRDGEDHMEIRGIDDLGLAGINPQLLQKGLAVGAAAVAAGIIVELQMPAVRTDRNIAPQF